MKRFIGKDEEIKDHQDNQKTDKFLECLNVLEINK